MAIICEKCGELMEYYHESGSCGMLCPKCGWGWATTYFSPIKADKTVYTVTVSKTDRPQLNEIKCIAELRQCNYLEAKSLLQSSDFVISGKAKDIIKYIRTLSEFGADFRTEPEFPYDIAEAE